MYRDIREIAAQMASADAEVAERGVLERAEELVREMRGEIEGETGSPPSSSDSPPPSILVQWWPKPVITPGAQSWVTDLLRAAGARATLEAEEVKSRPMSDEEVAECAPDAVVLSWCGVDPAKYRPDVVLRNPAWAELPFVRAQRVFSVGEPFLGRPGPRLVEGVRRLRAVVAELGKSP